MYQGNLNRMTGLNSLFLFHTGSNVGYAIAPLATLFYEVALEIAAGDSSRVHFGFRNLDDGHPQSLPSDFKNLIAYDYSERDPRNIRRLADYVKENQIRLVVIFDIQPVHPLFKALRKAGVRTIVSYWGAPISARMPLWKLALKRLQVVLSRSKVDGLIFESKAMADLAIYGRGVSPHMVDMVYNGVDISLFRPARSTYVYEALNLPREKKVVIYVGHMEPRKGVQTLIEAVIELLHRRKRQDVCFLLCGNKGDESKQYEKLYAGLGIDGLIRFGGYRSDLARIYPSCFCGVIPTTGWDSFPFSPIEMAASGLPVIASRLQGLCEAVLDQETGLLFEPGNAEALADCIETLLERPEQATEYARRGRERCERKLNTENQRRCFRTVLFKRLKQRETFTAEPGGSSGGSVAEVKRDVERRIHTRLSLTLPLLVRDQKGEEEVGRTANLTTAGLAVSLSMDPSVGDSVNITCPYTPGGKNIEQKAEIRWGQPKSSCPRMYGLRYL